MKKKCSAVVVAAFSMLAALFLIGAAVAQTPPPRSPELMAKGKPLYEQNCAPCHGIQGNGKGPMAAILTPPPTDFTVPPQEWKDSKGDPAKVFGIIKAGVPNTAMMAFALPDEDLWALVYTTLEFSGRGTK